MHLAFPSWATGGETRLRVGLQQKIMDISGSVGPFLPVQSLLTAVLSPPHQHPTRPEHLPLPHTHTEDEDFSMFSSPECISSTNIMFSSVQYSHHHLYKKKICLCAKSNAYKLQSSKGFCFLVLIRSYESYYFATYSR